MLDWTGPHDRVLVSRCRLHHAQQQRGLMYPSCALLHESVVAHGAARVAFTRISLKHDERSLMTVDTVCVIADGEMRVVEYVRLRFDEERLRLVPYRERTTLSSHFLPLCVHDRQN